MAFKAHACVCSVVQRLRSTAEGTVELEQVTLQSHVNCDICTFSLILDVFWTSFKKYLHTWYCAKVLGIIHNARPSRRCLIGLKFFLQHDNEPKHIARVIKNYLQPKEERGVLQQVVWPPPSPYLNIIESV